MDGKLSYRDVIADIEAGRIKNLYLFYGSETYLIRDAVSRIERKIIDPAFSSLNYINIEDEAVSYDSIVNSSETLPLMGKRKLVTIRGSGYFKPGKGGSGAGGSMDDLCRYLSSVPDTTVLIFIEGTDVDRRKKIYNCVKKYGAPIEFGPLKGDSLTGWVMEQFGRQRKSINRADVSYLTARVRGTLEDLATEISKLVSYSGAEDKITRRDIDAVIPKSLELNIFQLVDSVTQKKPGRALSILNDLLLDGEPSPVILTMIIRQYRLILKCRLMLDRGYSTSEIGSKLGLKPFIAGNLLRTARCYSVSDAERRLRQCLDADISIKTGRMDQRIAIEMLIAESAK